jgi:HSP20 family protein
MTVHTPTKDLAAHWQRPTKDALAPVRREIRRFLRELGDGWDEFNAAVLASPSIDIVDTGKGLEITAELPGLSRDDVKITVEDDLLTVSGDKQSAHDHKDHSFRLVERNYGAFSRSIYLPRSTDGAKIKAIMRDGVLKIVVPKRHDVETKSIEIQSA